ncbi:MAG: PAS domain-containing protein [Alphaproteobacteria bacterium]|nr:PAS domain-containing protein [Alphaproteobacteria bacterium]
MTMSNTQTYILRHWRNIQATSGSLPTRQDFTLRALGKHAAEIAILQVRTDPEDFEYSLIGTSLSDLIQDTKTGAALSEKSDCGRGSAFWHGATKAMSTREPNMARVAFVGPDGRRRILRTLYLPLADGKGAPEKLMLVPDFQPSLVGSIYLSKPTGIKATGPRAPHAHL